VDKLDGKPVEKDRQLAARLVTSDNLGDPDIQAQLNPDLKKYLQ
jgi:hypothetical protein